MPEHRIRLNRAWEIRAVPLDFHFAHELAATLLNSPVEERVDLPLIVDDEPVDEEGRAVKLLLSRWFNAPSNLQPGQRVQVVIEPAAMVALAQCNQLLLAVEPASGRLDTGETPRLRAAFELTGKLQPHNRLDILVGVPQALAAANIALVIEEWQSGKVAK